MSVNQVDPSIPFNLKIQDDLVSFGSEARKVKLSCGVNVTYIGVPKLNLFVISDTDGFGPTWIKVTLDKGVYTTQQLLGSDLRDDPDPVARFLARNIIEGPKRTSSSTSSVESSLARKEILLNLSLRGCDKQMLDEIVSLLFQSPPN